MNNAIEINGIHLVANIIAVTDANADAQCERALRPDFTKPFKRVASYSLISTRKMGSSRQSICDNDNDMVCKIYKPNSSLCT